MPKHCLPILVACAAFFAASALRAQNVADLETRLRQATAPNEREDLHFQLARNLLSTHPARADSHAQCAVALAVAANNKSREAEKTLFWASVAQRQNRHAEARARYRKAWEAATAAGLPETTLQAVEQLQVLNEQAGNYSEAYRWSRERTTLLQAESRRYLYEQLRKQEDLQTELKEQNKREARLWLLALAAAVMLMSGINYLRLRANRRMRGELAEKNAMLEDKRRRSEQLLLNILPQSVAAELTLQNKVTARRYERATVMFIDFVHFTRIAEQLEPEALVRELDYCFSQFDHIVGRFRLEKIKTVGDAYICAGGLSERLEPPTRMINAALQIQKFLRQREAERAAAGLPFFEARIGIHVGPVVAGVVGVKKFAYDIWGDTVNTAARIEEACEPGRINVSGAAQALAKDEFGWEYRGKVATKNKAEMDMYYVVEGE